MTKYKQGLVIISLLMQANVLLATEIFRSQDPSGTIQFSDVPSANATTIRLHSQPYRYKHHVAKVYDGDTIILKNGQHVRLLGINTPEIESRFRQGEAGGEQAQHWLQQKLEQHDVYLEFDQQKRDKYDRLLAYVFLDDENINLSLLQAGLATLSIIPPNLRYSDQFQQAQNQAEINYRGIWAMPSYQPERLEFDQSYEIEQGWHRFVAKPMQIKQTRKYIRLLLSKNVDIRIAKTDEDLFPKMTQYLHHRIEVRGWASRQREHYSIAVRHPSSIIILE